MSEAYRIELKGLKQMLKALKQKPPIARVGVLGAQNVRKDGTSNATIGAAHEFGAPARNLPQRSFLRIPLTELLDKELKASGLFSKDAANDVIKEGTLVPWIKTVARVAEGIVIGAFATGGYGKWPPWADPNYKNNANMLLVDTTSLRDSITSEVKGG